MGFRVSFDCGHRRIHRILEVMQAESPVLSGTHIRLEPLDHRHVDGLAAAAATDRSLYQWSPVPQGKVEATSYIDTALAWRDAGTAVPLAIVNVNDGVVIGSGHPRHARQIPDVCEIG